MSKKLGDLIKEARAAKGLTQAAVAEQVDGITASDVGKIERGEKEPTQAVLKKMAKGRWPAAYRDLCGAIAFPSIAAELCPRPCEGRCQRTTVGGDAPLNMGELERACLRLAASAKAQAERLSSSASMSSRETNPFFIAVPLLTGNTSAPLKPR